MPIPAPTGSPRMRRRPAHLHGCVQVAPQQAFGVLPVEGQVDWWLSLAPLPALSRAAPRVFVPISCVRSASLPGQRLLPKPSATGGLRSLRTSHCFSHRPNPGKLLTARAAAPLAAFRGWKVLSLTSHSLQYTLSECLGAVPKTTAPFANFQLHAHFHD